MIRLLVVIVLSVFVLVLPPAQAEEKDPNPFGLPDSVMSLPKELRSGQPFRGFPKLSKQVKWFQIPPWLPGTWRSTSQRILRKVDYDSGAYYTIPTEERDTSVESFGDLTDTDAGIWHALISPEIVDYQKDRFIDTRDTISTKMFECSGQRVLIWRRIFHIIYNPAGRQIVSAFTEERMDDFKPSSSGRLIVHAYTRLYDANGSLRLSAITLRTYVKEKKYQQRSSRAGVGLTGSLSSHLQYIGRHDLINW